MNRLIMTSWKEKILTALISDREILRLNLEPTENQSALNNIYIGKVKNIVKNINAAFIEFSNGQTGYYSLTENKNPIFCRPCSRSSLKSGDEILVQVSKDGVKSKAPVLTSHLTFTGKYCILTAGKPAIGFSAKIQDEAWKQSLRPILLEQKEADFGIIVRTNARDADFALILKELEQLKTLYNNILKDAPYRTCLSRIYQAPPAYIASIKDTYSDDLEEIVTDIPEVFQEMNHYLEFYQPEDAAKLRFYKDSVLPLISLYSLETALETALGKRVWLKSGGYLVIEPTEALVVIDVNTGKYSGHKNVRDTIMKINLEAAAEVGRQLMLRNLSGIIIIDFIDMEEEDKGLLMDTLEMVLAKDPVKTNLAGISKLNLVELTRKKVRKPLYEQILE